MGLYLGGLIIQRIFASKIWGGGGVGAYFREGLFLGWLIMEILRYSLYYIILVKKKKKKKKQQICSLTRKEHPTNIANTYP